MKNGTLLFHVLGLLLCLLVTQCTVEKRRYLKGFYVSGVKNTPARKEREEKKFFLGEKNSTEPDLSEDVRLSSASGDANVTLIASAEKNTRSLVSGKKTLLPPDSCSDQITFMNGDELKVRIEEIGPDYIAYRRCDYLDGPLIKVVPNTIFRIKYSNGLVKIFKHEQPVPTQAPRYIVGSPQDIRRTNGLAVASFVISFFSFYSITAAISIIFGVIALVLFQKYPDKYKGKWMAIAGIAISVLGIGLMVLTFGL